MSVFTTVDAPCKKGIVIPADASRIALRVMVLSEEFGEQFPDSALLEVDASTELLPMCK